ncbi:hypothetical protein RRF57_012010 [Xylaria bambusicola]|uniref:Uncharacterized protein n=1 Tax=Xylaria bambusicola TaxID=326684 RepID=A0AAN7UVT6_9PEZI
MGAHGQTLQVTTDQNYREQQQVPIYWQKKEIGVIEINPYTATARDLQRILEAGLVTSTDLAGLCLDETSKNNHHGLNVCAVVAITPASLPWKRPESLMKSGQMESSDLLRMASPYL